MSTIKFRENGTDMGVAWPSQRVPRVGEMVRFPEEYDIHGGTYTVVGVLHELVLHEIDYDEVVTYVSLCLK